VFKSYKESAVIVIKVIFSRKLVTFVKKNKKKLVTFVKKIVLLFIALDNLIGNRD